MKATSGHLVLDPKVSYHDLVDVFPEILLMFLEETDQMPEDDDVLQMFLYLNEQALQKGRKPEGYNRKGRMRLVFPMNRHEFYVKSNIASSEVVRVTEKIDKMLSKAGVKHSVEWDALGSENG